MSSTKMLTRMYPVGRRPALLDNLFQSLVLAPFFVLEEIMFKFGYRPDLKRLILKDSSQRILRHRAATKNAGKAR